MDRIDLNHLPDDAGVLICGHGSRAKAAEREFTGLIDGLRSRYPNLRLAHGFLEYSAPNIHMALDTLRQQGARTIYAVPGMLFAATHSENDIPSVLTTYRARYPELSIHYGRVPGLHPQMRAAFAARILQALNLEQAPQPGALYNTMLVVVGRGTSVAEANAQVAGLTRLMVEELGFGWGETVYSGVTFPSVGAGLRQVARLDFERIVVAPYFLFSGHLISRIRAYSEAVAAEHPNISFAYADYLRAAPAVVAAFADRIAEVVHGEVDRLPDFVERVERGEVHVHHHHAEFQPQGPDHHHHHHNGHHHHQHDHEHHHHAPYKHIRHPLGPRTMVDDNLCCCFMRQLPDDVIAEERAKRAAPPDRVPVCRRKDTDIENK